MELLNWIADIPSLVVDNYSDILLGLGVTLKITIFAIIIGIVWGTLLALMRLSNIRILRVFATCYVTFFRSIPLLIVLLGFYLALPQTIKYIFQLPRGANIGLICAIIAYCLFEAAYYSEIIRAGINSVNKGQYHAAFALGMTRSQAMRLIILPQAFKAMIPLLLTQGIILFQDTSLVYAITLVDLFGASVTLVGKAQGGTAEYSMIIFAAIAYFIISFSASRLVSYLRKD